MALNKETVGAKLDALSKLSRRAADIKAALKEVQVRKRTQEREDRQRLEALIGSALLADAEADTGSSGGRRAYIAQILDQQTTSPISRTFLAAKGWL
jgi:hypothetical protein